MKKFILILLIGILIRIILMPFIAHPDILGNAFYTDVFNRELTNTYNYSLKLENLPYTHPPANLYILSPYIAIIKNLIPEFNKIINKDYLNSFTNPYIFRTLFLLKMPYLILDILIALLIFFFLDKKESLIRTLFWVFNPIVIYSLYCYGQDDIFMIFCLFISLLFFYNKKFTLSSVFLALAVGFKQSAIFLYIPFLIFSFNNKKNLIKYLCILIFIPLLSISPFIFSRGFQSLVIFPKQSQGVISSIIPLGDRDRLYPFIMFYFLIIFLFSFKNKDEKYFNNYFTCGLSIFLLFFSIVHFHPQWLLWEIPLVIFFVNDKKIKYLFYLQFLLFFIYILYWGRNTSTGLLLPLGSFIGGLPSPSKIFSLFMHEYKVIGIFRSIFSGLNIFLIFYLFKKQKSV